MQNIYLEELNRREKENSVPTNTTAQNELNNRGNAFQNELNRRQGISNLSQAVAVTEQPDEQDGNILFDTLKKAQYHSNSLKYGAYKSGVEGVAELVSWVSDITGLDTVKEWADDTDAYVEKLMKNESMSAEIGEVVGRIGVGLVGTGWMQVGKQATTTGKVAMATIQGAVIEGTMFEGKESNVADLFKDFDIDIPFLEYIETDENKTETQNRFNNAVSGGLAGLAVDSVVGMAKYGRQVYKRWKADGNEFEGTDAEKLQFVNDLIIKDMEVQTKAIEEVDETVKRTPKHIVVDDAIDSQSKASGVELKDNPKPNITPEMDNNLKSAKPRYYYKDSEIHITFKTDIDKAVYIASSKQNSAFKQEYIDFLDKHNVDYKVLGTQMRNDLKAKGKAGETTYTTSGTEVSTTLGADDVAKQMSYSQQVQSSLLKNAENIINQIDTEVAKKSSNPINASKLGQADQDFATRATDDVSSDFERMTFEEVNKKADEYLKQNMDKESYDLVEDMTQLGEDFNSLSTKAVTLKLAVAGALDNLNKTLKLHQTKPSVSTMSQFLNDYITMVKLAKPFHKAKSMSGQTQSFLRDVNDLDKIQNMQKALDAIDTDENLVKLQSALGAKDVEALETFMEELADTTRKLPDILRNADDNLYKKITNILAEHNIAGMLSSPVTLVVNVLGNSTLKAYKQMERTMEFFTGQALRGKDRMSWNEYKYGLVADNFKNIKDLGIVSQGVKRWWKDGLDDDTLEEVFLVKYNPDQATSHQYIDTKYIFGDEVGSQSTKMNNLINIYGKVARTPYSTIGFTDDYYKRSAFRAELVRSGSRILDARNIPNEQYNEFMDKFIKVNTELRLMMNRKQTPSPEWRKKNAIFVGTGEGLGKYVKEASEFAKKQTFQADLGEGMVGKSVKFLNSDGLLRILIPFKQTPINILKTSLSIGTDPIRQVFNGQIAQGGRARDVALAKLTTSSMVMAYLGYNVVNGNIMGNVNIDKRATASASDFKPMTFQFGDERKDFSTLEPFATLAGIIADSHHLISGLKQRFTDARDREQLDDEFKTFMGDIAMILANNITNKHYTKSLFDVLDVTMGDKSLVDYLGKTAGSTVPLSSLTNYVGRVTNSGFKKEAKGFMENVIGKYRWALDRDALDVYGRKEAEISNTMYLGLKQYDINLDKNAGANEVFRLGMTMSHLPKTLTYKRGKATLTKEQHYDLRDSLNTKFHLADKMNNLVRSKHYQESNDTIKELKLSRLISKTKTNAGNAFKMREDVKKEIIATNVQFKEKATGERDTSSYYNLILNTMGEQ